MVPRLVEGAYVSAGAPIVHMIRALIHVWNRVLGCAGGSPGLGGLFPLSRCVLDSCGAVLGRSGSFSTCALVLSAFLPSCSDTGSESNLRARLRVLPGFCGATRSLCCVRLCFGWATLLVTQALGNTRFLLCTRAARVARLRARPGRLLFGGGNHGVCLLRSPRLALSWPTYNLFALGDRGGG